MVRLIKFLFIALFSAASSLDNFNEMLDSVTFWFRLTYSIWQDRLRPKISLRLSVLGSEFCFQYIYKNRDQLVLFERYAGLKRFKGQMSIFSDSTPDKNLTTRNCFKLL